MKTATKTKNKNTRSKLRLYDANSGTIWLAHNKKEAVKIANKEQGVYGITSDSGTFEIKKTDAAYWYLEAFYNDALTKDSKTPRFFSEYFQYYS